MHPHLQRCRDGLRLAMGGLTPAEAESSADGKWSIAGIIEHLDLSYTLNIEGLEHRLQKGAPAVRHRTVRQNVRRLIVTRLGYFPTGRSSPPAVLPKGRPFVELSIVIDPHLMLLDQRLKDVARAFGPRTPVLNHPILGPFSVADWRRFHWVHTRHHLRQMQTKVEGRRSKVKGKKKVQATESTGRSSTSASTSRP